MSTVSNLLNLNVGGKAESLIKLKSIAGISVPPFISIPASCENLEALIQEYLTLNPNVHAVAVRSSALVEDGENASFAGAFDTFLDVEAAVSEILDAVKRVRFNATQKVEGLSDYMDRCNIKYQDGVGVVVQEMVSDPDYSGVVFSHGLESVDAYFQINFHTGLGEEIVSGRQKGGHLRFLRQGEVSEVIGKKYPFLQELINAVNSIEKNYSCESMDIEFAYKNGCLYILQARPMTVAKGCLHNDKMLLLSDEIKSLNCKVHRLSENDFYGDMIDINPRELLGENPQFLNVSIFGEMFADDVVERVRGQMGYAPLYAGMMEVLSGKPYVSLRSSAYSMRPKGVSDKTYEKVFQHYLSKVRSNVDLQDKVEFQLFSLTGQQAEGLVEELSEILDLEEVLELTGSFNELDEYLAVYMVGYLENYSCWLSQYQSELDTLERSGGCNVKTALSALIKGTSYFTATARLAFYAKNAAEKKYGESFIEKSIGGLDTVSGQLQESLLLYAKGEMTVEDLNRVYGHLRAGQMDIFTSSYKDNPEYYFNLEYYEAMDESQADCTLKGVLERRNDAEAFLNELSPLLQQEIVDMRMLLQAREAVKFEFARAFDLLSRSILDVSKQVGFDKNKLGSMNIDDVIALSESGVVDVKSTFMSPLHKLLILPAVFTHTTDLNCVELEQKFGTFFSGKVIEAPVIVVKEGMKPLREDVEGRIIVLDHADPGFDFLLSYEPAGLITKVGGPASHMAIRLSEYGLPGCIGSGIDLETIDVTKSLVLDCKNKCISEGREL